jgi:hypothetical protein
MPHELPREFVEHRIDGVCAAARNLVVREAGHVGADE